MSERKYKRGKLIRSISSLEKSQCTFFIVTYGAREKTTHRAILISWQYRTLKEFIDRGWIFEAERIEDE